ncbi:MAG: spermidine synthase [Hyphomicrobiaceae bacterium]
MDAPNPHSETADGRAGGTPATGHGLLLWVFTATTFFSALLLFSVQPMFTKMVLPILGGAPSVWAVALVFFQGALLAGYGYAHALNGHVAPRTAGFVHLALLLAAFVALPIGVPTVLGEPPAGEPYLWQFGLFTVAIGLPFLAVAANAPLLQAWFAATGHPHGRDPYFLYAASNLGSFIALLGYPFLLEPVFGLSQLSRLWTIGFVLLALAIAGCFMLVRRSPLSATVRAVPAETADVAPTWQHRLGWTGLALVPAGLLTAITTHIATDIASAPLIWVIPLSLYLLTFVLVFRERLWVPRWVLLWLHVLAVPLALLQLAQTKRDGALVSGGIGLAAFFIGTLVAHRTLYEARPTPRYLTEYYLWMSFGGVLGGLFAALIAPQIFSQVFEYPLLLALTFACRPGALSTLWRKRDESLWSWLVLATGLLVVFWGPRALESLDVTLPGEWGVGAWIAAAAAVAIVALFRWPSRQLALALVMFLTVALLPSNVRRGAAERSYFGVYRVAVSATGEFHTLTHGTTLHGAQRMRDIHGQPIEDLTPATYYHPGSPMAKTIKTVRERLARSGQKGRYAVIGLGTGSMACHAAPGEQWRFFEIDPTVVRIASNRDNFSFLHHCLPDTDIVIGDARLTLAKEADGSLDALIVDAFSSDAVPVHLMTVEALKLYASKLKPEGIVLLHISNRYLDLDAVVGATAPLVPGLSGFLLSDDTDDGTYATSTSTVAVFSKSRDAVEELRDAATDMPLDPGTVRPWTDDYSDILRALKARWN